MYMILAMFLIGSISFGLAITWHRRKTRFNELFIYLGARYNPNEIDLSGKRQYSNGVSYGWVIKNVIYRRSKIRDTLRELMAESTLLTTMVLGSLVSIMPIAIAYLIVGGFASSGGMFLFVFLAILLVYAPFDVAMSYELLSWLVEQDPYDLKESDFAYAQVSWNTISRWIKILLAAGVLILTLAPWSNSMLELSIYGLAALFGFVLNQVYIPLANINAAVAYVAFVSVVVTILVFLYIVAETAYRIMKRGENIFSLKTQGNTNEGEQKTI
jgi:hypothetical protein